MVTGRRLRNRFASLSIDVHLNGNSIENVIDFKLRQESYLDNLLASSITLDQDLAFDLQIEELNKKLVKRRGLFRQKGPYLKRHQREIYYSTIIKHVFLYGSLIWTSCSKENLQKLLRLQKRAARIILNAEKMATSVHLFNTLNWIPFYAESFVNRCTLAYKRLNGNTPEYINDLPIKNSEIHNRTTR